MYKQEGTKVAIIGAGAVGSTTAFAIAMQQLCSELVLIDVNKEKALGEALDISHGLPFIGDMYIHAGDYSDVKDADERKSVADIKCFAERLFFINIDENEL